MSARRSTRTALCSLALMLGVVACGGGDDGGSTDTAATPTTAARAADVTTTAGGSPTTAPLPTSPKAEFKATTASYTFVNAYAFDGKAMAVDVWWGFPTLGGEKALTVEPGQVSPATAVKVRAGITGPRYDAQIVIMPKGITEQNKVAGLITEPFQDGDKRTIIVGSEQKLEGRPASYGGTTTTVFVSGTNAMGTPPAGKAYVFVSNVGLRHLGTKGDFVVPGVTGACFSLDNSIKSGNAGTAHAIDPGAKKLALFDANTDCKTPLGETEVPAWFADLPDSLRDTLCRNFVDAVARVHAMAPLPLLGEPVAPQAELARWRRFARISGNDRLVGGDGLDTLNAGAGTDVCVDAAKGTTFSQCETVTATVAQGPGGLAG